MKKYNRGKQFHEQQKYVYPFVLSVDGMLGKQAMVVLVNLSQLMADKMDKPILHVCGCIVQLRL